MDCRERCSDFCMNNEPCHHVNGACPSGCQEGYIGELCNDCKKLKEYFFMLMLDIKSIVYINFFFTCIFSSICLIIHQLVAKIITAETVPMSVRRTAGHVDTQTDFALVKQVGRA